jgi:glutamate racemase
VIYIPDKNSPIGVFDSGVGGLTVFREIRETLPFENIIYLGDTARVPYGSKSQEVVIKYSVQNVEFLLSKNVKSIVVACNTASAASLPYLTEKFPEIKIIGVIDPVVEYIRNHLHRKRNIAVVGTNTAVMSGAYQSALKALNNAEVISKACPLFVPLVEEGMFEHSITDSVINMYLSDIRDAGIDAIILGCTHYPMLKKSIERYLGDQVSVLDTAYHTAVSLKKILTDINMLRCSQDKGFNEFYVTDSVESFRKTAELFLNFSIKDIFHI